jgi:ribulose-bisphosphate carboxylase small chain
MLCRFFETFSYLPPLSDAEVAKQVDYITRNGFVPCLEFAESDLAYVSSVSVGEFLSRLFCDNPSRFSIRNGSGRQSGPRIR